MLPKKRDASALEQCTNNTSSSKKPKIENRDLLDVDSGFQNINNDIAKHILHHLKLDTHYLNAMSQTCSSWNSKITTYYREMIAHIAPLSYKKLKSTEKHKMMEEVSKTRQHVSDIQLFQYYQDVEFCQQLRIVPWCKNIVISQGLSGLSIIDLRKPDPVINFPSVKEDYGEATDPLISINMHRKQLVVSRYTTYEELNPKHSDEEDDEDKEVDSFFGESDSQSGILDKVLCVYNISNDGQVDLVKQIEPNDELSAILLRDDGSIWAAGDEVQIFHVDSDLSEKFDYKFDCRSVVIRKILEIKGDIKFILHDMSSNSSYFNDDIQSNTKMFDAKTKQHYTLPIDIYEDHGIKVEYTPDVLIRLLFAVEDLDGDLSVSPDGSRLIKCPRGFRDVQIALYAKSNMGSTKTNPSPYYSLKKSNILFYDEEISKIKSKKRQKKAIEMFYETNQEQLTFFWLTNDVIVAALEDRISILDFSSPVPDEGFKSFKLPLTEFQSGDLTIENFARIDDTSFLIYYKVPNKTDSLIVFKITV